MLRLPHLSKLAVVAGAYQAATREARWEQIQAIRFVGDLFVGRSSEGMGHLNDML